MTNSTIQNPFRPGAGHQPPYLAGREEEKQQFLQLLEQEIIMHNLIISGLRGIGKTVLLESFRPLSNKKGWLWAGTDCSESSSVDERTMAIRILTDVALITSNISLTGNQIPLGFSISSEPQSQSMDFNFLIDYYEKAPGLVGDKLKATLLFVWEAIRQLEGIKGIVFAYDEAQTLSDHVKDKQYPLSLLLDVFQFLQKRDIPFMLVLTGLPTLLTKLVETRTYSERLFSVMMLEKLNQEESKDAILKPITKANHPAVFDNESVKVIYEHSGGYPYFIQFICREAYDVFEQQLARNEVPTVPIMAILQKLDNDFFAGRWEKATDREQELMSVIANAGLIEFGVQNVVELSQKSDIKAFSSSQVNQMFNRLITISLIFKNKRGSYSFAVPLLEGFIKRWHKLHQSIS
jgi:AAA+ ATPase superfamily predicted ATPase